MRNRYRVIDRQCNKYFYSGKIFNSRREIWLALVDYHKTDVYKANHIKLEELIDWYGWKLELVK